MKGFSKKIINYFRDEPDYFTCNVVRLVLKDNESSYVDNMVKFIKEEVDKAYKTGLEEGRADRC